MKKSYYISNRHHGTLKTIFHVFLTKGNAMSTKYRRASMQLTMNKNLNDGFITLCHVLHAIISRVGHYVANVNQFLEIELISQHDLVSQKLLQCEYYFGPGITHERFTKALCDCEPYDSRASQEYSKTNRFLNNNKKWHS